LNSISQFIISLEFKLFWAFAESLSISEYHDIVAGEWMAIPRTFKIFQTERREGNLGDSRYVDVPRPPAMV